MSNSEKAFIGAGAIIILVLIFWRQGREAVTQIIQQSGPLSINVPDPYEPDYSALGVPVLRVPVVNGVSSIPVPTLTPVEAPGNDTGNGCCCGDSNGTRPPRTLLLTAPSSVGMIGYTPPPCRNIVDWDAMTDISTPIGRWLRGPFGIGQKNINTLITKGYPPTPGGWAKYVNDNPGYGNSINMLWLKSQIASEKPKYTVCR